VDWNEGAGPRSCTPLERGNIPLDLWFAEEGAEEGPAAKAGFGNPVRLCTTEDPYPPADPEGEGPCIYEDLLFSRRATTVIQRHADTRPQDPFFLFYSPHAVHEPLQVPKHWYDRFPDVDHERRRRYRAMVSFLDDAVGNITDTLQSNTGMWEKTVLVFASDNGGPIYRYGSPGANNHPLRGGKASNWEGGIRVNSFVSGGMVPAKMRGKKLDGLVALWDWYATFASLAGVDPTDESAARLGLPPVDSVSVAAYVMGTASQSPRRSFMLGAPDGWRDIWGGTTRNPLVNGVIVDERDQPGGGACSTPHATHHIPHAIRHTPSVR